MLHTGNLVFVMITDKVMYNWGYCVVYQLVDKSASLPTWVAILIQGCGGILIKQDTF